MDAEKSDATLAGDVDGNVVVLRSFSKFFGLAGLRLGFALASPAVAARLRALLGPWAVSGPAVAVGTLALADRGWIAAARTRVAADAARLEALLAECEFTVAGGTPLFRLVHAPDAPARFDQLGRAGILVRRFAEAPHALRFGLPAGESAWRRLRAALTAR